MMQADWMEVPACCRGGAASCMPLLPTATHRPPGASALPRSLAGLFSSMSHEVVTGLNTLKKGSDPPLRDDDQLPEWLWALAEPGRTLNEMRRMRDEDLSPEMVGGVGWRVVGWRAMGG